VEHRFLPFLGLKPIYVVFCAVFLLVLAGCKQPIENPETIDPIYADLEKQAKEAAGVLASEEKSVTETREKLKALPPRDILRGQMTRELYSHEKNVVQMRQRKLYLEIRTEQRKDYDQKAYKTAFDADKVWPEPSEAAEYKKIRRLQTASRSWDERVPKTNRYNKAPTPDPKEAKKPEGGEGHGGEH
jgi:hypothetical protein